MASRRSTKLSVAGPIRPRPYFGWLGRNRQVSGDIGDDNARSSVAGREGEAACRVVAGEKQMDGLAGLLHRQFAARRAAGIAIAGDVGEIEAGQDDAVAVGRAVEGRADLLRRVENDRPGAIGEGDVGRGTLFQL